MTEKRHNGKRLKTMIAAAVTAAVILLLALIEHFLPLNTLLPAYAIPPREEGEMRIHFLYAGQGDCTVLEFPDGDVLVVDAGGGAFDTDVKLVRYLKGLNATSYSFLVSHADLDHFGGFTRILHSLKAETVYLPVLPSESADYRAFLTAVENAECGVETLTRYGVISRPSGAYGVCISPRSFGETDTNDSSAVLYFNYEGVGILLAGDVSREREEMLAAEYSLIEGIFDSGEFSVRLEDTQILKVSHHGSAYSSSENWLSLISPAVAVISCGQGNIYSHPSEESVARLAKAGAEIYRTDELGNIVVSIQNNQFTVHAVSE